MAGDRAHAGGTPAIVFSHANGFPAGTYRVHFEAWRAAGYAVHAIERIGHDPAYPVSSNWPRLREQLVHFIEREVGGPAYLVGHSLGGMLSLLVACRRPDLARGLLMIDSPVVTGWRAHGLRMAKATGLIERISPGKVSRRRRQAWDAWDDVLPHFARKAAFARWDPRVLRDYVDSGFDRAGDGAQLGFRRDIETRIYDTLPHNLGPLLRRHPPRCPVGFLAGNRSVEMRQAGVAASRKLAGDGFEWVEGGHLFPMERPDETAAKVLAVLERWRAAEAAPSGPSPSA